ncbi:Peptidyl-tRNA hydrolase [Lachnospiraceae bacterium TWA4]|nr:Peptidyl-tRNA hydrolase [Lachnospiraceae bacterium TWA4]
MIVIVGLGNPGKKYEMTRHNMGFEVIDELASRYNIEVEKKQLKALVGKGAIAGCPVMLVKPQTYMNLSGESVRAVADYYKVEPEDIYVIFDDVSLDVGQIRIRKKGSAGGHNGIKSIIAHLGTQEFPRIKVGVGEPKPGDLIDHVLGHFHGDDLLESKEGIKRAADAMECILKEDIAAAMNEYNQKKVKGSVKA